MSRTSAKSLSRNERLLRTTNNLALLFIALVFALPLAWLVLASLDPGAGISSFLPESLSLQNYQAIMRPEVTVLPLWNSFLLSFGTAGVTLLVSVLAAYPLSRYRLRFNRSFLYVILFSTSLPITAIMVPVYSLFVRLGQLDSIFSVILFMSAASLPMAIWMTKNFMDAVPVSLEEAAWVDGASPMKALWKIVVPLMRPGLSVVYIFIFIQAWGNFFVPFLLLFSRDKEPAAITIFRFFGQYGQVAYGELAAFSILYALPVIMLYLILARSLGGSFAMSGAVKG